MNRRRMVGMNRIPAADNGMHSRGRAPVARRPAAAWRRAAACVWLFAWLAAVSVLAHTPRAAGAEAAAGAAAPADAQPPSGGPAPPGGEAVAPDANQAPQAAAPAEPPPPPKKFYELEPYDIITLDKTNDNKELKVMPLQLPERRLPEQVKRVGKLKVRLFDDRADEYEVAWRNIEKVDFFEELVLREAGKVVAEAVALTGADKHAEAQAKYDEAFEFYQWLLKFYPQTQGLQTAVQDYLYLNAGALFRAQRVEEAFAVLEELYRQNREYRYQGGAQTALAALERVGERLIGLQTEAQNYRAARLLLERLQRGYGSTLQVTATWRDKLIALATVKRDEAAAQLAAKRFREAHEAGQEMLRIWPALPGGREVVLEIARQYPLVVVGVAQPALTFDAAQSDDPAACRTGYLLNRTLVEFVERGPEGGAYASPWGTVQQSADRTELIFELRPQPGVAFSGYDLSSELLAMADPGSAAYRPAWAGLMSDVKVQSVRRVRVKLRHPHVLPQGWLQVQLGSSGPLGLRYRVAEQTDGETRFEPARPPAAGAEPSPVIVERYYAEPRKAIEDLRKGKIDAIDRVLPNDALRLRNDDSLHVGTYAFPSLHVLISNRENPFLDNRVFRRALLYGINREVILHKGLLNEAAVEGTRVVSAPLPAGVTRDDPAAYAYDESLAPLPYDPVMSAILLRLADQQLGAAADKKKEKAPELKELVLAHPAGELPRFVCKQIQTQWNVIGVKCALRELPPGQCRAADGKFDLLYAEFTMREPITDAAAVFGPRGLTQTADPFLSLTLRRLDAAANWKEARDLLHDLHRQLFEDVTLLPLWQMIDSFAYQSGLTGLQDRPIAFYQNVEQWRVVPPVQQE